MATLGSHPIKSFAVLAEAMAISANSSSFGSGRMAQSAKINAPFSPNFLSFKIIRKELDTFFIPGAVFIICRAGLMVSAVV